MLPIILWWAQEPLRFSVGRSRKVVCMVSLWAIAVTATANRQIVHAEEQKATSPKVLREGTKVPPMIGRVVMAGRRWAFVPMDPAIERLGFQMVKQSDRNVKEAKSSQRSINRRLSSFTPSQSWPAVTLLSSRNTPGRSGSNHTAIRLVGQRSPDSAPNIQHPYGFKDSIAPPRPGSALEPRRLLSPVKFVNADRQGQDDDDDSAQEISWLLVENLVLERIVQAIRRDSSDNKWVVSGKTLEFFGENRMLAITAQRPRDER